MNELSECDEGYEMESDKRYKSGRRIFLATEMMLFHLKAEASTCTIPVRALIGVWLPKLRHRNSPCKTLQNFSVCLTQFWTALAQKTSCG
jgi:hypothetical protein